VAVGDGMVAVGGTLDEQTLGVFAEVVAARTATALGR
jgi:hypothetical protein